MDPSFTPRCIAGLVFTLAALLFVKSELSSVDLSVVEELVLRCDGIGHSRPLEEVEESRIWNNFAFENAVESQAALAAERDRLGPRKGTPEKDVLKVGLHELVLELIAVVVNTLHDSFTPRFGQPLALDVESWIELNQSDGNVAPDTREFEFTLDWPGWCLGVALRIFGLFSEQGAGTNYCALVYNFRRMAFGS